VTKFAAERAAKAHSFLCSSSSLEASSKAWNRAVDALAPSSSKEVAADGTGRGPPCFDSWAPFPPIDSENVDSCS